MERELISVVFWCLCTAGVVFEIERERAKKRAELEKVFRAKQLASRMVCIAREMQAHHTPEEIWKVLRVYDDPVVFPEFSLSYHFVKCDFPRFPLLDNKAIP